MDTAWFTHDVMLVCRNGHVLTDRFHGCPDHRASHCEVCGADTLSGCPTCGRPLAPLYCSQCGAAFPWTPHPRSDTAPSPAMKLESMLRRFPEMARQLRTRQTDRPPFRIQDERDLEDLVRALLPLDFEAVRL